MVNTPAYQLFGQALAQALAKQQMEQQQQAQVLQSLGFGKTFSTQPGMIPNGYGAINIGGQAYVRPGGMPQDVIRLLAALLGADPSLRTTRTAANPLEPIQKQGFPGESSWGFPGGY